MRVLIIDDDSALTALLTQQLNHQKYIVDSVADGETGWAYASTFEYDLIVLDWLLPQLNGIRLCQRLRHEHYNVPILLLTAKDQQTDKIKGLEAGADDYVVKPFDMTELLVRIRVLLRRAIAETQPLLSWGELCLDPESCQVSYQGHPVAVTAKEYTLLELFLRHSNQAFSTATLLDRVWSSEKFPSEATVRSHIRGLRRKLKQAGAAADLIETVHGLGYRLKSPKQVPHKSTSTGAPHSNTLNSAKEERESRYLAGLRQAWQAHKGESLERWQTLVQISDSLQRQSIQAIGQATNEPHTASPQLTPRLSEQQQRQAQQIAHSLAGTLGTFGLMEGYRLSLQIEQLIEQCLGQSSPHITPTQATQLHALVNTLGHTLDDDPKLVCPIENAPSSPEILVVDVNDIPYVQQLMALAVAQGLNTTLVASIEAAYQSLSLEDKQQSTPEILVSLPDVVMVNLVASQTHCVLDEPILQRLLNFISQLNQCWPQLPIVVITPQADFGNRLDLIRRGGVVILEYPVAPVEVLDVIRQVSHLDYRLSKIMIVDDDAHYLKQVIQLLHPWDFQITPLTNPQRFWTLFNQVSPDLIVLDIEMPHINGFELCQVIRSHAQWQHLPIVFLSVHSDRSQKDRAFTLGADDYITKPIQGKSLATRLLNRLKRSGTRLKWEPLTG
ncbi:MAG: response regulator [Cyanobacteria bacterium J06621_11]